MKLIAVDTRKFSRNILREAVKSHSVDPSPIQMLASNGEVFKTFSVNYHNGERYPSLERDSSKPDILSLIIKPHAEGVKK
jgi:hypothetical protein